jgi:hypothetical protein
MLWKKAEREASGGGHEVLTIDGGTGFVAGWTLAGTETAVAEWILVEIGWNLYLWIKIKYFEMVRREMLK